MADFLVQYWVESTKEPAGEKTLAQSVVVTAASAQAAVDAADAAGGFDKATHPPDWAGTPVISCLALYTVT